MRGAATCVMGSARARARLVQGNRASPSVSRPRVQLAPASAPPTAHILTTREHRNGLKRQEEDHDGEAQPRGQDARAPDGQGRPQGRPQAAGAPTSRDGIVPAPVDAHHTLIEATTTRPRSRPPAPAAPDRDAPRAGLTPRSAGSPRTSSGRCSRRTCRPARPRSPGSTSSSMSSSMSAERRREVLDLGQVLLLV